MSNRDRLSRLAAVGGTLIILAFVVSICIPNFISSPHSKTLVIINNLRQLDGAIQMWALDHGQTGAVLVTKQDLAPYLTHPPHLDGWVKPVAGERYILKGLYEPPEAELTRDLEGRPKGSVLRLSTNGFDVILPGQSGAGKRRGTVSGHR